MPKLAAIASSSADQKTTQVLDLISHFRRTASAAVGELKNEFHIKDLLRALKQARIGRTGRLKRSGARYTFHGAGCRFEFGGRTIEVEFGPDGRVDGFDEWRLQQYASSAFEWQKISRQQIARGLNALESVGTITKPGWEPNPGLYYLNDDLN